MSFTDVDETNYPYRASKQAREAMGRLKAKHGLNFTHNPGGGEFYKDGWGRCQVHMCDDVKDYEKLINWVAEHVAVSV